MKAVKVAHKASFTDETDKFDALETILEAARKKPNRTQIG